VKVFWPRLGREEAIRLLRERTPRLAAELPLVRAVLFGSYAKGNYAVGSDLDLLIVYRGERREDAYGLTRRLLGIPGVEPHVYTEGEYSQLKSTLDRMCEPGVVLYPERGREL
jgi:predicted nucleotidyltransferase